MKNIIITTLAPLALFGAYSLFEPATITNSTDNKVGAPTPATYKKEVVNAQRPLPETCVIEEDTFTFKPLLIKAKHDPAHHNIAVYRDDRPKSYVTIKF